MLVIFRVDASVQIGSGHVVRCLTLAKALRDRGHICRFVSREHEGNMLEFIRNEGFNVDVLSLSSTTNSHYECNQPFLDHADWLGTGWQMDAEETIEALAGEMPSWLIVDHYALDSRWEIQLRGHVNKIMVIDDVADRHHDCNILLDQNFVIDFECRYENYVPIKCVCLLGPKYALLQAEYAKLRSRTTSRLMPIRRILISFGGVDQHNLTNLALSALLTLKRSDIVVDVVISSQNSQASMIRAMMKEQAHINVYENLSSLAPLMLKADLAIGAGGTTSWERCCLGLPTLLVTLADNQKPIARALDKHKYVLWIGHYDSLKKHTLTKALKEFIEEPDKMTDLQACMNLVDGKGCDRVVSIMSLDEKTPLKARLVCSSDEELLLCLVNDPLVRDNSFNKEKIDKNNHHHWFSKRLRMPEQCKIYIVETNDGLIVGYVRFERSIAEWETHFALAVEARGRKLGKLLLQTAMHDFRHAVPNDMVFGLVKYENIASQKIFKELGFTRDEGKERGYYYYKI